MGRAIMPLRALAERRGELLADALHLLLLHRREERQRQRVGGGGFGDWELALAVAELTQVREEVDAGQVGLGGDTALAEAADHPVAVGALRQADGVDEPAADLGAAGGD